MGKIPIDMEIREGGDTGTPIVESSPESAHSKAFNAIACAVAARVSVLDLT